MLLQVLLELSLPMDFGHLRKRAFTAMVFRDRVLHSTACWRISTQSKAPTIIAKARLWGWRQAQSRPITDPHFGVEPDMARHSGYVTFV